MIWGVGEGGWVGMQEFSEKFPGNLREISGKFPGKCVVIRKREIDLVNREIKIFTAGSVQHFQKCYRTCESKFL